MRCGEGVGKVEEKGKKSPANVGLFENFLSSNCLSRMMEFAVSFILPGEHHLPLLQLVHGRITSQIQIPNHF